MEIFTVLVMTLQQFLIWYHLTKLKNRAGITKIIAFEQKYLNVYG
jgi:hypothetical protein